MDEAPLTPVEAAAAILADNSPHLHRMMAMWAVDQMAGTKPPARALVLAGGLLRAQDIPHPVRIVSQSLVSKVQATANERAEAVRMAVEIRMERRESPGAIS